MIVLVPTTVYEDLIAPVRAAAPGVRLVPYVEEEDGPIAEAARAEAVLRWIAGKRYAALIADSPRVRWLHTASAGVDHVLTPAVRARAGLTVTDSGPAFAISIGEFVLMWMLMVAHRLPDLLAQQRDREWKWVTQEELHGQTVGIIGLGPVGRGIAQRCQAMGMRTLGLRRRDAPAPHVDAVLTGKDGINHLLAESDWVIVAAALTDETRALLGAGELARMKPTARLINVARGPLVDEDALIHVLQQGRIAGACLDVFATEPLPGDSPLWSLPNVYVSPHTSPGWTTGLRARQIQLFLDNLRRFLSNEPLEGVVDIARGY